MKVKIWGARGSTPAPIKPELIREKIISALLGIANTPAAQLDELTQAILTAKPAGSFAAEEEYHTSVAQRRLVIEAYLDRLSPLAASTAGGNTPCLEIRSGNDIFVIDAGSGLRDLGAELMNGPCGEGKGVIHLFFSHPHWDHIQGFPFFRPAFIPGNQIFIYGVHDMETALRRQQEFISFPISLDYMQATKTFITLTPNQTLDFADLRVRNMRNHHPGDSYSYRFEKGNRALVYASDASYPDGMDLHASLSFFTDADLLIFDAQFTQRESDEKEDWGHSSSFVGVEMAQQAKVKNLVLFHHAPAFVDQDLEKILEASLKFQQNQYPAATPVNILIAQEGQTFDLTPPTTTQVQQVPGSKAAILKPTGIFDEHMVAQVREHLAELTQTDWPAQLIIDMAAVEMLQVAGLRGLVKLRKEYQGTPMALAAPSLNVQQLIELAGYLDYFAIYPSVHVALNALKARETLNLPGHVLKNRYRIEAKVGEGRLGTVFKATDLKHNAPVAIKILSPSFSEAAIEQFLQQARQIVNLTHPNIINVYDCDEDRGIAFMAEEMVENRTLRDLIDENQGRPVPNKVAVSVAQDIIRALEYGHAHGVIHGDLKPKNVLFDKTTVKVSDFGLGRLEGGNALINIHVPVALGSARYLAPEQVQGQAIDARADLYAFGVILYELFTGAPVFEDLDPEIVDSYLTQPVKSPRELNPNLSRPLEHLIRKLLNPDPTQRYATARQVRQVLNSMAVAVSRDRTPGIFTTQRSPALIGRNPNLQQLANLWAEAEQGRGQVVFIHGEAGQGKTRLIQELACRLNNATVLMGEGQQLPGYPPYNPLITALRAYINSTPAPVAANNVGRVWQHALELAPEAGQLGLELAAPAADAAPTLLQTLAEVTATQPWLIIVDDLHLADAASLELFGHLARCAEQLALMLVATVETPLPGHPPAFTELVNPVQSLENCTTITLQPLSASQLKEFLESIWLQPVPPDLAAAIFARTQGNPLFAETIANGLIDEGVINWRDEKWHFGPVMETGLPATLPEAVLRRVSRLSRETQTLLNQAAVLGPIFNIDDLNELSDLSEWDALESIDIALERQFLKNSPGEPTLRFSHPVIQQAIYGELSLLKQRLLHREAAEALERRYQPHPKAMIECLAYHFAQAQESERALPYIIAAAQKAAAMHANQAAIDWYNLVLDQTGSAALPTDRQFDLLLARQKLHFALGNMPHQTADLKRLEQLARQLNQPDKQAQVNLSRAQLELTAGRTIKAETVAQNGLVAARAAANPLLESESLIQLAEVAMLRGNFAAARECLYTAQNNLPAADNPVIAAKRLNSLGALYHLLNNYTESEQYFRQAVELSRQTGNRSHQAIYLSNLGGVLLQTGQLAEALRCLQQAEKIARLVGHRRAEACALNRLGAVYAALGQLDAAEKLANQAKTDHKTGEDEHGLAAALRLLGQIYRLRLDYVTARDLAGQALEIFQHAHNRGQEGESWLELALALEGLNHAPQALHAFEQVNFIAEKLGNHTGCPDANAGLARLWMAGGKINLAVRQIETSLAELVAPPAIWQAKYPAQFYLTAFEVLSAAGQPAAAATVLQTGQSLLRQRLVNLNNPQLEAGYFNNIPQHRRLQQYAAQPQPKTETLRG